MIRSVFALFVRFSAIPCMYLLRRFLRRFRPPEPNSRRSNAASVGST
jgi:hypothetical protein